VRGAAAWLGKRFRPLALVGTIVGVTVALWTQRHAIASFDWRLAWAPLVLAAVLFAVPALVQGLSFWLILRFLDVPTRAAEALVIWMRSFLLRYAPTGALAFAVRVRERERLDASKAEVWTASGYEQLVALVSGALACVAAFALARAWPPFLATAIALVAVGAAVAIRPRFLGRRAQGLLARRGIEVPGLLRGRRLALVAALNVAAWIASGAAVLVLLGALSHRPSPGLAWLTGVYAFAWLLGFVVPLLPGGLGLRDGTLVAFLGARYGAGPATALALALRLANTLGEFAAIGGVEGVYRLRRALTARS
jgi:uncharacterized membrane protein YbhN (UPF0104 family)